MTDDSSSIRTKAQIRWQRNKEAQRKRAQRKPVVLSQEFLEQVETIRKMRQGLSALCEVLQSRPEFDVWTSKSRHLRVRMHKGYWFDFVADVWAATVLIEAELGAGKATPSRVAARLETQDRLHGYTAGSARVMVYRARETVAALEKAALADGDAGVWLPVRLNPSR